MWSFAAVLFMALSGKAPYTAESGDKDFMLDKIMMTKLDVSPLRRYVVSAAGIGFLQRLLNVRPELRPMEVECLRDPWLDDGKTGYNLEVDNAGEEVAGGDDDGELDASQLSIHGDDSDGQHDLDLDEPAFGGQHGAKRPRTAGAFAPREDPDFPSSPEDSSPVMPSTPSRDSYDVGRGGNENRLFGEVGASALGSSGVVPHGQQLNLGLHDEGDVVEQIERVEATAPAAPAAPRGTLQRENAQSLLLPPESAQTPGSAAPSLLGAEAMVRQLHVASPSPRESPTSTPRSQMLPTTPKTREASPTRGSRRDDGDENGDDDEDEAHAASEDDETPRKFSRRIDLPIPDSYYYDPYDKTTHNAEYAAKMRALQDGAGRSMPALNGVGGRVSEERQGQRSLREGDVATMHRRITSDSGFARPPTLLGKLTTTRESCIDVTVNITQRATSWGRGGGNTHVYPDGGNTLIPKYAFDILFWRPGLAEEMAKGAAWTDVADVPAMIMTRTSLRIHVNGVKLVRREREGNPYGELRTGDVVTIFRGSGKELEFRCEFFHGASAARRAPGAKPFEIRHAELDAKKGSPGVMG